MEHVSVVAEHHPEQQEQQQWGGSDSGARDGGSRNGRQKGQPALRTRGGGMSSSQGLRRLGGDNREDMVRSGSRDGGSGGHRDGSCNDRSRNGFQRNPLRAERLVWFALYEAARLSIRYSSAIYLH